MSAKFNVNCVKKITMMIFFILMAPCGRVCLFVDRLLKRIMQKDIISVKSKKVKKKKEVIAGN